MIKVKKSKKEWRQQLTPEQFWVCRKKGTEPPFSGEYWNHKGAGTYRCVCCKAPLFDSKNKYDSGTGWPSFWQPLNEQSVATRPDLGLFSRATEVICSSCGSHLGHVFSDGPPPTHLRYCINSVSLEFNSIQD